MRNSSTCSDTPQQAAVKFISSTSQKRLAMTGFHAKSPEPLKVLMTPIYRNNPYQSLLANAIEACGAQVDIKNKDSFRSSFSIKRVVMKAERPPFDILHLHWIHPFIRGDDSLSSLKHSIKFLTLILLLRRTGIKIVWTVHNRLSHGCQTPRLELYTRQALSRLVHRLIFHNESSLKKLSNEYKFDKHKARVIPHGHYKEVYGADINAQEARRALNLPPSGRVYLNIGMLKPYKGIERLLSTWHENTDFFREDTLVIAGQAESKSYLSKLRMLVSGSRNVQLHPEFIPNEKMPVFFGAADFVVLPFEEILTSGSLILSISYGKPVIAPRLGGIEEALGDCGTLLYDVSDSDGLASALKKSKQVDPLELSQSIIKLCEQLDWGQIGRKTYDLYLDLVLE